MKNILDQIFQCLRDNGWQESDSVFKKTLTVTTNQVVIINGVQQNNTQQIPSEIRYIGEGSLNDVPIYGFQQFEDTVYIYDLEDFKNTFKL